jgi:hypothetical protein
MISIQRKFLFVHVPKTGGNSIQAALEPYSEDKIVSVSEHHDGVDRFEVRSGKYAGLVKHSTLDRYKAALDAETYGSLYKFAVIRNPWDRMISCYFSPHRGPVEWDRERFLRLLAKTPGLRHYVREKPFVEKWLGKLGFHVRLGNRKLGADVDTLIRFEELNAGFKSVCEILDIPFSPLPERNKSSRKHYSTYYDEELKEAVRRRFLDEVEYGDYDFESA